MNPKSDFSPQFKSAEAQRLYYLQVLGINTYYPRVELPGARVSEACELPDLIQPEMSAAPQTTIASAIQSESQALPPVIETADVTPTNEAPADKAVRGRLRISLDEDDADHEAVTSKREEVTASDQASQPGTPAEDVEENDTEEASEALQFQTILVLAENNLALCVQIPSVSNSVLSERELRLMHNILFWLKSPARSDLVMRSFNWPLPGIAEQSVELAAKSLSGFLQQSRQELGFNSLVVMGSSLLDVTERMKALSTDLPWQQINTHSLAEMLAIPELKRSCWQQLIPLQARLSEAAAEQ